MQLESCFSCETNCGEVSRHSRAEAEVFLAVLFFFFKILILAASMLDNRIPVVKLPTVKTMPLIFTHDNAVILWHERYSGFPDGCFNVEEKATVLVSDMEGRSPPTLTALLLVAPVRLHQSCFMSQLGIIWERCYPWMKWMRRRKQMPVENRTFGGSVDVTQSRIS